MMNKTIRHISALLPVLCFLAAALSEATTAQEPDTLQLVTADTLSVRTELDTNVNTSAEKRFIDFKNEIQVLEGTEKNPAWFTYQDMRLEAIKIILFGSDSLIAESRQVAADPDSFPGGYRYIGLPVFTRTGDDPMTGLRMVYNLETKKGRVEDGRTKFDGGFYFGKNVTRIDDEYLQIRDGYFTTCDDEDHPHYHFSASQMKMKVKDKVVAKPVVFYIDDIPLMVLPFGMFPIRRGRNSGMIVPSYGESAVEGRYLQGIGYYFAPNDYVDAKLLADYYDKSGVLIRGDLNYAKRYALNGTVSGSVTRKNFADRNERRWDLRINHDHTIDPTMNVKVRGSFQSDNSFYKNFSSDRNQRAKRLIKSSAIVNKRWENSSQSMRIQLDRTEDLSNGNVTELFPSVSFNWGAPVYPFRGGGLPSGTAASAGAPFYSTFNYSYTSQLKNSRSKTALNDSTFKSEKKSGVQHSLNFSSPQRVLRHFSINPGISYTEEWFNERIIKSLDEENEEVTGKEKGFFARRQFRASVSANTKFYGTFNTDVGRLKTVRHVVTPSVSYNYTPDFSKAGFGYYGSYRDTTGSEVRYDRYQGSAFGGTGARESKSLRFTLDNLFQARTVSGDTENKFDVLNVNSGLSYNLAAAENRQKWSDINSTIRIMKLLNMTLNTTHSLYEYSTGFNAPPELLLDRNPWWKFRFLRLTKLSTSTSFTLSARDAQGAPQGLEEEGEENNPFSDEYVDEEQQADPQERFEQERIGTETIPWELSVNLSYSDLRTNPDKPVKRISANTSFEMQVTDNWRMNYRGNFDLVKKEIVYHDFSFYRDLHCWELHFNWTPSNASRPGFFIEIRIKDSKLRDIKVKKTDYGGSAIGYIR
ncbi:LPS assembly protein LptD [candidate division KSB1 bacterium]